MLMNVRLVQAHCYQHMIIKVTYQEIEVMCGFPGSIRYNTSTKHLLAIIPISIH